MARRIGVVVGSATLLVALAFPAFAPGELDSLPLSSYPMFAHPRSAVSSLVMAVNLDADGVEHRLDPHQVGGTDQPMQAMMAVRQAISRGAADQLCHEIAAVADHPGTIEIVTLRIDVIGWYEGRTEPVERIVHAACPVERA